MQTTTRGRRAAARRRGDIQDKLAGISDRADLERLFARHVSVNDIVKLAGRNVSRARIQDLLRSPDLSGSLKKLLDS